MYTASAEKDSTGYSNEALETQACMDGRSWGDSAIRFLHAIDERRARRDFENRGDRVDMGGAACTCGCEAAQCSAVWRLNYPCLFSRGPAAARRRGECLSDGQFDFGWRPSACSADRGVFVGRGSQ